MVSITLDEIISYHPPPPKLPSKPSRPHISVSGGLCPPPSKSTPPLTHPLPSRPPRTPSPAVLRLYSHSPHELNSHSVPDSGLGGQATLVSSNAFDRELAKFDLVEIEDATAVDTYSDGSEPWPDDCVGNIRRQEPDGFYNEQDNDSHGDNLRYIAENLALRPEYTGASEAAVSEFISCGSTEPKVSGHVPSPFAKENERTQHLVVVSEGAGDDLSADAASHASPSREGSDSQEDHSLHNTGSLMAQCGEESAATPLSDCSCREIADLDDPNSEIEKDTHAINPACHTATDDGHDGVEGDENEAHAADSPNPVSCSLQQLEKQPGSGSGSGSGSQGSPSDSLSRDSISLVIPEPQSSSPGIKKPVRRRRTDHAGKRKSRPKSPGDVDSDDPDDDDYVDGDDGLGDIDIQPRPAKRQRRTVTARIASDRVRHEARDISPAAVVPSRDQSADNVHLTRLHDIETIPIRGFLTRQIFLSKIVYSCSFQEDREPSFPNKPAINPTDREDECQNRYAKPPSSRKLSAHTAGKGSPFSPKEEKLLVELKEEGNLSWSQIAKHFPGRTKGSLQVRYSTRLKDRGLRTRGTKRSGRTETILDDVTTPYRELPHDLDSRLRTTDGRRESPELPTNSPCRQRYGPPRSRRAVDRYNVGRQSESCRRMESGEETRRSLGRSAP